MCSSLLLGNKKRKSYNGEMIITTGEYGPRPTITKMTRMVVDQMALSNDPEKRAVTLAVRKTEKDEAVVKLSGSTGKKS